MALNFPVFIVDEMRKYRIDQYINMGDALQLEQWRTLQPAHLFHGIDQLIQRRLN